MHYVSNERVRKESNKIVLFFAVTGWVALGLVIVAGYVEQHYGAKLW